MGRVIGIDFGLKRTGIAISDETKLIASGLETVASEKLDGRLTELMSNYQIEVIVLGYPKDLRGKDTNITENVRLLKQHIKSRFPETRIEFIDERFTSSMAAASHLSSGMSKKKRRDKQQLDMTSATIILQDYLNWKM